MEEIIKTRLEPAQIMVCVDSREKLPLNFAPMSQQAATLHTGDYSILGLEHKVALERKSLQDLIACVGRERERFDREIQRLLAYEVRAIFIEGHISQIEMKQYRSQIPPGPILSSIMGWMAKNIPIFFCENHQQCELLMGKFINVVAQRYWRELYPFYKVQTNAKSLDTLAIKKAL